MATYVHPNAQAPTERTNLSAGQPVVAHARFVLPTANLLVGDTIRLTRVPAGAKVMNCFIRSDKLDNGGSPAFAFNLAHARDLYEAELAAQA